MAEDVSKLNFRSCPCLFQSKPDLLAAVKILAGSAADTATASVQVLVKVVQKMEARKLLTPCWRLLKGQKTRKDLKVKEAAEVTAATNEEEMKSPEEKELYLPLRRQQLKLQQ